MKTTNPEQNLFLTASTQGGYFTAFQAFNAGFDHKNHAYHVKAGNWIREFRGIYRLSHFPIPDDAQYALWSVWSLNRKGFPQGIYSHETALSLFDLSDLQDVKLHMTLPRGYRRHCNIPEVLQLHHATISLEEREERNGYLVTRPFRTIADIVQAGTISPEFIKQAVKQSLDRGYLTITQYTILKIKPRIGKKLSEIMGD